MEHEATESIATPPGWNASPSRVNCIRTVAIVNPEKEQHQELINQDLCSVVKVLLSLQAQTPFSGHTHFLTLNSNKNQS